MLALSVVLKDNRHTHLGTCGTRFDHFSPCSQSLLDFYYCAWYDVPLPSLVCFPSDCLPPDSWFCLVLLDRRPPDLPAPGAGGPLLRRDQVPQVRRGPPGLDHRHRGEGQPHGTHHRQAADHRGRTAERHSERQHHAWHNILIPEPSPHIHLPFSLSSPAPLHLHLHLHLTIYLPAAVQDSHMASRSRTSWGEWSC